MCDTHYAQNERELFRGPAGYLFICLCIDLFAVLPFHGRNTKEVALYEDHPNPSDNERHSYFVSFQAK